ncbi:MAG TPA: tRNA dimethylallyltransferase, partial [Acidobacteriaceae bacterium]
RQPLSVALGAESGARDPLTGYRVLRLGLEPERQALYARIDARAAAMFRAGLVAETEGLLRQYGPGLAALDALGYRQAAGVLRGELTLEEAVTEAQRGHRQYAKRQMTWFRREPEVVWLRGFGEEPGIGAAAEAAIAEAT